MFDNTFTVNRVFFQFLRKNSSFSPFPAQTFTVSSLKIMEQTQVVIIGAGPIGIEVAALLKRHGVRYYHFERGQIGDTMHRRWPPGARFFSSPERVAIVPPILEDGLLAPTIRIRIELGFGPHGESTEPEGQVSVRRHGQGERTQGQTALSRTQRRQSPSPCWRKA